MGARELGVFGVCVGRVTCPCDMLDLLYESRTLQGHRPDASRLQCGAVYCAALRRASRALFQANLEWRVDVAQLFAIESPAEVHFSSFAKRSV